MMALERAVDEVATFFARNNGEAGGIVRLMSFSVDIKDADEPNSSGLILQLFGDGTYVGPGAESNFEVGAWERTSEATCEHLFDKGYFESYGMVDWVPYDENDSAGGNLGTLEQLSAGLECSFLYTVTDISGERVIQVLVVNCDDVRWLADCFSHVGVLFPDSSG